MRARVMMAALTAALSLGCTTSGGGGTAGGATRGRSVSMDVIDETEIVSRASEASNALQIVEKLRPQMLRGRGTGSPTDVTGETTLPKVYVDDVAYGNLHTLSNLNATQIKEIRYLKSADATTRWGTGHMGGVILVTTKK